MSILSIYLIGYLISTPRRPPLSIATCPAWPLASPSCLSTHTSDPDTTSIRFHSYSVFLSWLTLWIMVLFSDVHLSMTTEKRGKDEGCMKRKMFQRWEWWQWQSYSWTKNHLKSKVAHTFYCWYCLNVFFKAIHTINIVKAEIIKRQNKSDHKTAADIQPLVIAPCASMTIISWLSCLPLHYQQFPLLLQAALLDMLFSKLWQVKRWRLKTKTWNAALCLFLLLVPVWDEG